MCTLGVRWRTDKGGLYDYIYIYMYIYFFLLLPEVYAGVQKRAVCMIKYIYIYTHTLTWISTNRYLGFILLVIRHMLCMHRTYIYIDIYFLNSTLMRPPTFTNVVTPMSRMQSIEFVGKLQH